MNLVTTLDKEVFYAACGYKHRVILFFVWKYNPIFFFVLSLMLVYTIGSILLKYNISKYKI